MKKYLILAVGVISVLIVVNVYAQPGAGQGAGGGRGAGGMGGRGGMGGMRGGMLNVEAVNAAITEIEAQVSALKEAMEGAEPMTFGRGGARGGAEGGEQVDFQAIMAAMQERQAAVQAAAGVISEQLLVLDSNPLQTEITELQAAATQATEEEAEETAALIQAMITTRQETAQRLGIRVRGARGGMRGGMMGGMGGRGGGESIPGGFEWID